MNGIHVRKGNVPLTPNLEQYKQKNKSKSRRKQPYSIQPTNPPTPKIHKAHINLRPTQDKQTQIREPTTKCQLHPQRLATRFMDGQNKCRFCTKCYLLRNDNEENEEQVQYEKKKDLDEFKMKIKGFGLKLQQAQTCIREWGFMSDQNFYKQKEYIHQTLEGLRVDIDQKERQLINRLMSAQQLIKRSIVRSAGEVQQIKKAIARYLKQIDSNYDDIVESLPYDKFTEIIEKYNNKIRYYEQNVEQICLESSLNVYIPKKEIQKLVEKSAVQVYPDPETQDVPQQNRTLQRYPTQKNNLYVENKGQSYLSHHHESVGHNKISQHRQSRDRQYFANNIIIANKQNLNYDNYNFH